MTRLQPVVGTDTAQYSSSSVQPRCTLRRRLSPQSNRARLGLARAEPPWIIPVSWNAARLGSPVAAGDQDFLRQFVGPREIGRMARLDRQHAPGRKRGVHPLLRLPGDRLVLGELDIDLRNPPISLVCGPQRRFGRGMGSARLRNEESVAERDILICAIRI